VVHRLAFSLAEAAGEGGVTWLEIERPDGRLIWYGLPGRVMEPQWTWRLLVLMLVGGSLLAWAAWSFTRKLTRPLERLRQQIREGRSGDVTSDTEAPPEIAEIEAAHAELLRDLRQQERERALLLAGVSHDLRSPLARIRMAVELMPDSADTANRRTAIVRNVSSTYGRLTNSPTTSNSSGCTAYGAASSNPLRYWLDFPPSTLIRPPGRPQASITTGGQPLSRSQRAFTP